MPWRRSFASFKAEPPRKARHDRRVPRIMTDEEFIASFESCDLASECFHHTDHVRMAFLYLRRYPAFEALQRFSTSLARFANAHGKPELYHETITWAFVFLIRER